MILMPPGSAKSTYATVRAPAYFLGRTKRKGVICASYNDELASSFGRKVRNLVDSADCRALFPELQLSEDMKSKGEWETKDGGFYFAVGVGGGVTGRRADLIVIDDPIKGREDADSETNRKKVWAWYLADLRTRAKLDGKTAIVLIQTRWHEDDLAGRILPTTWNGESGEVIAQDGEKWTVICLPASAGQGDALGRAPGEWLWPEVATPETWEAIRTSLTASAVGVRNWLSLYQQTPTVEQGTYFKREWFDLHRSERPSRGDLNMYMAGDFAVTPEGGDFTDLGIFGLDANDDVYVLDWWFGQDDPLQWSQNFVGLVKRWQPIWFAGEAGVIRRATEGMLTRAMRDARCGTVLKWLPSGNNKQANAKSFAALASMGRVHFPNTPWAERVIDQLLKFPGGKYDDAVDTCSLFAREIQHTWASVPDAPDKPTLAAALAEPMRIADFAAPQRRREW